MNKPKVWHLLSNRWNSAITEYALSAARALELAGYPSVFSPLLGSPAQLRAEGYGLTTLPVRGFDLTSASSVVKLAREVQPTVVFCYGGAETIVSKFVSMVCAVRGIVRFRGVELTDRGLTVGLTQKLSHSHVSLVITPSDLITTQVAGLIDCPTETVILGCDTSVYRRVRALPGERPELQILGRFDPVKGHGRLIEIFARVKALWPAEKPRPFLHIVGEAANLSLVHMRDFVTKAGLDLDDDVKITCERVTQIAPLLSGATLGIVSSLGSEAICRVAEEYLLCGTPVIVSGVGSLSEVLFEGAGASYRGLESTDDIAQVIVRNLEQAFAEDENTRQERADSARTFFSLETMSRRLDELLVDRALAAEDSARWSPNDPYS